MQLGDINEFQVQTCCHRYSAGAGREFMIAVYSQLEGFDECRQGQAGCLNETPATSCPDGHVLRAGDQL